MTKIVALVGQKGGIGKTTTTMNMAAMLTRHGRVLVVDTDPQGSSTWWGERVGEDKLPFDFAADQDPALLAQLRKLGHDYVIVDTPGNLQDQEVLQAVLDQADFAIVPMNPEPLTVQPLIRTIRNEIEPREVPYRVLLSKIEGRMTVERKSADGPVSELAEWQTLLDESYRLPRFKTAIRMNKAQKMAPLHGKVVTDLTDNKDNRNYISDYAALATELRILLTASDKETR